MRRMVWLVFATCLGLYAGDANEELLAASRGGDLAAVRQLIEKGAAIEAKTAYGQTPLYLAAMNGHEEVVRFLLEKGPAPMSRTLSTKPRRWTSSSRASTTG